MESATPNAAEQQPATPLRTVVVASAAGTAFEWYDFFVYGALTSIFAAKFFNAAEIGEANATLATLAVFAAGLFFRPLGALIFGRMGDRFGRKGAFLATVIIMGGTTFAIGLLPDNKELMGFSALALVLLRILQGMAIGGEYGGAAIYVAEHCEPHHRGESTAWIQSSAAFGLMGALAVVLSTRAILGEEQFVAWGWRVPFLFSALLVAVRSPAVPTAAISSAPCNLAPSAIATIASIVRAIGSGSSRPEPASPSPSRVTSERSTSSRQSSSSSMILRAKRSLNSSNARATRSISTS